MLRKTVALPITEAELALIAAAEVMGDGAVLRQPGHPASVRELPATRHTRVLRKTVALPITEPELALIAAAEVMGEGAVLRQ